MVPQVTTKLNGRSKRALLPFVGNIARNFFGVATEGDVRKLAGHINALTKQTNKIVGALKQYGGNFASFLTQTFDFSNTLYCGLSRVLFESICLQLFVIPIIMHRVYTCFMK